MNKEWVLAKEKEERNRIPVILNEILEYLDKIDTITIDEIVKSKDPGESISEHLNEVRDKIKHMQEKEGYIEEKEDRDLYFMLSHLSFYLFYWTHREHEKDVSESVRYLKKAKENADKIKSYLWSIDNIDRYLDLEPVEFEGNIVITDPCYFIKPDIYPDENYPDYKDFVKHENEKEYPDFDGETSKIMEKEQKEYDSAVQKYKDKIISDWNKCDCGYALEKLGFGSNLCRDTLIGDWSCAVMDTNKNIPLGGFCADAGMVCVVSLKDILKYNPEINIANEESILWTVIKNFKGRVQIIVEEEKGIYETDSEYHKAGDEYVDYSVIVEGHGINTKTNEPIDFSTRQTGF